MTAYSPNDPVWNVMTRTLGGVVSLLRDLTENQARGAMQRLRTPFDDGDPWSEPAIAGRARMMIEAEETGIGSMSGKVIPCSDADLAHVSCWGPDGMELVVWPKPDDYDERLAEALAQAREVLAAQAARRPAPAA